MLSPMPMAARTAGPASQKMVCATGMISVRVSASPVALIGRRRRLHKGRHWAGSWLLSFELADPGQCLPVCNRLRLPIKATGLADTRTLIIPVAHTIFWEAGPAVRAAMGMGDSMIRLSVGLEDPEDLLADFEQALG